MGITQLHARRSPLLIVESSAFSTSKLPEIRLEHTERTPRWSRKTHPMPMNDSPNFTEDLNSFWPSLSLVTSNKDLADSLTQLRGLNPLKPIRTPLRRKQWKILECQHYEVPQYRAPSSLLRSQHIPQLSTLHNSKTLGTNSQMPKNTLAAFSWNKCVIILHNLALFQTFFALPRHGKQFPLFHKMQMQWKKP